MNMNVKHSYLTQGFSASLSGIQELNLSGISFPFNEGFLFLLVAANNLFNAENILR